MDVALYKSISSNCRVTRWLFWNKSALSGALNSEAKRMREQQEWHCSLRVGELGAEGTPRWAKQWPTKGHSPTTPEADEQSRGVTAVGPIDGPGIIRQNMVTGQVWGWSRSSWQSCGHSWGAAQEGLNTQSHQRVRVEAPMRPEQQLRSICATSALTQSCGDKITSNKAFTKCNTTIQSPLWYPWTVYQHISDKMQAYPRSPHILPEVQGSFQDIKGSNSNCQCWDSIRQNSKQWV